MTIETTETAIIISPEQPREITPLMLLDRALSRGADMATLEKFMDLQERHERNQARRAFDEALAAAKAEFPVITKNRVVDFVGKTGIRTNYIYEDLAGIAQSIDPILGKHGLSYRYRTSSTPNEPVIVTCILAHRGGHSEENTLTAGRDESGNKNAIQAIASAVTYLQRYTLKAALGLAASNDDDGRSSGNPANGKGTAPGPTGPVSDIEGDIIRGLIVEANADLPRFLKAFAIERVEDLPAARFREAKRMLDMKIAQAATTGEIE